MEMSTKDRVSPKWGKVGCSAWRINSKIDFVGFGALGLRKLECKSIEFLVFKIVEICHGCEE